MKASDYKALNMANLFVGVAANQFCGLDWVSGTELFTSYVDVIDLIFRRERRPQWTKNEAQLLSNAISDFKARAHKVFSEYQPSKIKSLRVPSTWPPHGRPPVSAKRRVYACRFVWHILQKVQRSSWKNMYAAQLCNGKTSELMYRRRQEQMELGAASKTVCQNRIPESINSNKVLSQAWHKLQFHFGGEAFNTFVKAFYELFNGLQNQQNDASQWKLQLPPYHVALDTYYYCKATENLDP